MWQGTAIIGLLEKIVSVEEAALWKIIFRKTGKCTEWPEMNLNTMRSNMTQAIYVLVVPSMPKFHSLRYTIAIAIFQLDTVLKHVFLFSYISKVLLIVKCQKVFAWPVIGNTYTKLAVKES